MDELRNYASHGQLIVSVYSEVDGSLRAAFDVEQLRSPIFIQQKPRVQEQLSSVADALNDIEDGPAYLSYCLCMDSFFEAIARLYRKWLQRYRPLIERITGEASDLYRKNSENIRCYSNGLVFSVVMEGAEAHLIEGRPEDTLCLYLGMLDAAQEYIEQTATNLKETSSHFTNPLAD